MLFSYAIAMICGPQLIIATLLSTTKKRFKFVFVYSLSLILTIIVCLSFLSFTIDSFNSFSLFKINKNITYYLKFFILIYLIYKIFHTYINRRDSHPPIWQKKILNPKIKGLVKTGILLIILMPVDIVTMITISNRFSNSAISLLEILIYLFYCIFLIYLPLIIISILNLFSPKFVEKIPKLVETYAWGLNIFIYLFFISVIL